MFFFEKKNQKTFSIFTRDPWRNFLLLFSETTRLLLERGA